MEPAMQYSKGCIVIASDRDELMIWANCRVHPAEKSVFGDSGRREILLPALHRSPHARSRLDMPPPELPISLAPILVALRFDVGEAIGEWGFVKRCYAFVHLPTEIDDPFVRRAAGNIHAVHPRPQYGGVWPTIRVQR